MTPDQINDLVESIIVKLVENDRIQEAIESLPVEDYDKLEDDLYNLIENFCKK